MNLLSIKWPRHRATSQLHLLPLLSSLIQRLLHLLEDQAWAEDLPNQLCVPSQWHLASNQQVLSNNQLVLLEEEVLLFLLRQCLSHLEVQGRKLSTQPRHLFNLLYSHHLSRNQLSLDLLHLTQSEDHLLCSLAKHQLKWHRLNL